MAMLTQDELDKLPTGTRLFTLTLSNDVTVTAYTRGWNEKYNYFVSEEDAKEYAKLKKILQKLKG